MEQRTGTQQQGENNKTTRADNRGTTGREQKKRNWGARRGRGCGSGSRSAGSGTRRCARRREGAGCRTRRCAQVRAPWVRGAQRLERRASRLHSRKPDARGNRAVAPSGEARARSGENVMKGLDYCHHILLRCFGPLLGSAWCDARGPTAPSQVPRFPCCNRPGACCVD